MRKISLFFLFAVILLAAGCGAREEPPGTFRAGRDELDAAAKMPNSYVHQDISLRYPDGWKIVRAPQGTQLLLNKEAGGSLFQANFTLISRPPDPNFANTSAQEIKTAMDKMAGADTNNNMTFSKVEKGKWQGVNAVYIEYKVNLLEQDICWAQYYYDTGKAFYVLSFAAAAQEWSGLQKEARQIFCSVAFKK